MSHRITFKSQMTNPELTKKALDDCKVSYKPLGDDLIQITSGRLTNATINMKTGEIVSDSDFHSRDDLADLEGLRQAYSEAEFRLVAHRQGAVIESRRVNEKGEVKILCRMHG